jgi:glutamate dehydrogenase
MKKNWIPNLEKKLASSTAAELLKGLKLEKVLSHSYRDDFPTQEAVDDLERVVELCRQQSLQVRLIDNNKSDLFSIKLYNLDQSVPLSDSMSIIESMGLAVQMEKPYQLNVHGRQIWIHHFTLRRCHEKCAQNPEKIPRYFEELFLAVWRGSSENDAFNQLLFTTCLKERNISLLRAYTAYLHQINFPYSQSLIIETLNAHPLITLLLVKLFLYRFDPTQDDPGKFATARDEYLTRLNDIESLDQDLIFRQLLNLVEATVRTNFFQPLQAQDVYISFKLDSAQIHDLPKPRPVYEIFVYGTRFEGIHLRGGKVARGGLRWSDRREDYRTEVLGLMKAQMVKNAVIVPAGSKGGFVTKQIAGLDRDATFNEVRACYQLYIRGLLELTDNMIKGKVVHPADTVIHDQEDPYLVVAADKGTATFSDTANAVSIDHGFWLQDAFASGGSAGYDHKKMGITARGAWESVKRHFRVLGKDIQSQPFRVVGIGDMSGDVFGNGMLLSPVIQLVGAFNHLHIFIDPEPDVDKSFAERKRLFELPRSSWADYNKSLISKGGGVFSRKLKKIPMSAEMKAMCGCQQDHVTPDQLIRLLLKAPVDLLWNGGIGTYVKASSESDAMVKDKTNDALRINGSELRARVVGEGGNLGFTQLGRIEYAKKGGLVYTDSIDNSAGVDCSDHEVNLKIMFSRLILKGEMQLDERNHLLAQMTDEVAALCLVNNYDQTQIIDMILMQASSMMHEHDRFIRHLERDKVLNRKLEYLPSNDSITERIANNQGLTQPELCILLSYSKLTYKSALLSSDFCKEPYFNEELIDYFPHAVRNKYQSEILTHPLKQEIIATQLTNRMITTIGPGFGFRMREETGANIVSIAKAFVVCEKVFDTRRLWLELKALDNKISEQNRYNAFKVISGLLERCISWLLRNQTANLKVEPLIERYRTDCERLRKVIPQALTGHARRGYTTNRRQLLKQGLPQSIANELAAYSILASAFDIIEIRLSQRSSIEHTSKLFFAIAERLQLDWILGQISETNVRNHWHQLAVLNMRNELHRYQQQLTELMLKSIANKRHITKAMKLWLTQHDYAIRRYDRILNELQALRKLDFTMTSVAVSEVRRLLSLSN